MDMTVFHYHWCTWHIQLNSLALGLTNFISVAGSTIHASTCKGHSDRWLNGCRSRGQAYQQTTTKSHTFHKTNQRSQACVKKGCLNAKRHAAKQKTRVCRQQMHSGCCLPASHSWESNSTGEDPCGQAQVYPPGRRRQRWLHTFLQGLGTEEESKNNVRYWWKQVVKPLQLVITVHLHTCELLDCSQNIQNDKICSALCPYWIALKRHCPESHSITSNFFSFCEFNPLTHQVCIRFLLHANFLV